MALLPRPTHAIGTTVRYRGNNLAFTHYAHLASRVVKIAQNPDSLRIARVTGLVTFRFGRPHIRCLSLLSDSSRGRREGNVLGDVA